MEQQVAFLPSETVYCRFTGDAFTVLSCAGGVAVLGAGGVRMVGDLTREPPAAAQFALTPSGLVAMAEYERTNGIQSGVAR